MRRHLSAHLTCGESCRRGAEDVGESNGAEDPKIPNGVRCAAACDSAGLVGQNSRCSRILEPNAGKTGHSEGEPQGGSRVKYPEIKGPKMLAPTKRAAIVGQSGRFCGARRLQVVVGELGSAVDGDGAGVRLD